MDQLIFVIMASVQLFINGMMIMLAVRALAGFFADEDSKILAFSSIVTEPVVAPVRSLLSKFSFFEDSPIDFSLMASYLVLILIQYALPVSF